MTGKLAIVAGGGDLPRMLVDACRAAGREFVVIAFTGHADPAALRDVPHVWLRLGAVGRGLAILREEGVEDVVMAGAVRRPSLVSLRPDWRAVRFLMKLGRRGIGDDGLLRRIVREFEEEGFRVVGADEILTNLTSSPGTLGMVEPDAAAMHDIARGIEVLRIISGADVGQAVVVQDGIVLGVEAVEGTDALLSRCDGLRREGPGGVLVKMRKTGQETRVDLPTIGPETVRGAAAAGLRGIAVEAGGVLILDQAETIRLAGEAGLFVHVFGEE
jgi:DUF1009 family protein